MGRPGEAQLCARTPAAWRMTLALIRPMAVNRAGLQVRPMSKSAPEIVIANPDTMGKPLGQYSQITRVKASEFCLLYTSPSPRD